MIESCLTPDQDIQFEPSVEPAVSHSRINDKAETEVEFHGFGEEEQAKAKEQSQCIAIESDMDDDASASATEFIAPVIEDVRGHEPEGEEQEEEELDGLSGHELYRCGNIGCDETTATAATLKVFFFSLVYLDNLFLFITRAICLNLLTETF